MALIKKDKSVAELKEFMVQQMDAFLKKETKRFVEMIFTMVDTKAYINPPEVKVELTQRFGRKIDFEMQTKVYSCSIYVLFFFNKECQCRGEYFSPKLIFLHMT